MLILRCSPHHDVEESLTHQLLAALVRSQAPHAVVDIAFMPPLRDQEIFNRHGIAWPLGVNTLRTPKEFDIVMLSVSYVLELLNVLPAFRACSLPGWSSARTEDDPIVVLGGAAAPAAAAALRKQAEVFDSLADVFFFGEFEPAAEAFTRILEAPQLSRTRRLEALGAIEGFWIPASGARASVQRSTARPGRLGAAAALMPVINGPEATTARLQMSLGCPFGCSFCFEGHGRKPYRDISAADLIEDAKALRRSSGAQSLDLISFNFNTHKELPVIMAALGDHFSHVHFMSQRLDILNRTEWMLENEVASGKRSFTLGVEGISGRMRRYFAKGIADRDIFETSRRLLAAKVKEIKYFFILTGIEDQSDHDEFASAVAELARARSLIHSGCRLVFSFGALCRMPFTPLQYGTVPADLGIFTRSLERCRNAVETVGAEFRTAFSPRELRFSQAMALGGLRLDGLLEACDTAGITYYGSLSAGADAVLDQHDRLHPGFLDSVHSSRSREWQPVFAFVAGMPSADSLWNAWQDAGAALDAPPVPPTALQSEASLRRPGPDQRKVLAEAAQRVQKSAELWIEVSIPADLAGAHPVWLSAWLQRRIMALPGAQAEIVRGARLQLPETDGTWPDYWYGSARFVLNVDPAAARSFTDWLTAAATDRLALGVRHLPWPEPKTCRMSFHLPTRSETVVDAFNRSLGKLGLNATLTKREGTAWFTMPERLHGKKSLRWLTVENAETGSFIRLETGFRLSIATVLTACLGGHRPPFTPIRIEELG